MGSIEERTIDECLYDLSSRVFDLMANLECFEREEASDMLALFGFETDHRDNIAERHGEIITASDGKDLILIAFTKSSIKLFGESFAGKDDFEIKRRP